MPKTTKKTKKVTTPMPPEIQEENIRTEEEGEDGPRFWEDSPPETCDVCHGAITNAFYDAEVKDSGGMWGNLCPACWQVNRVGAGIGPGVGQAYEKQTDGRWRKTGG